jgi:hypothetical protein
MTKTRDLADLGGGFIQVGTGAVQRTVESKLQDVVSVKDFGAVGNGVADDTAAIQAAVNTGKQVVIPSGTYIVSTITLVNNVSLKGQGNPILKKKDASASTAVLSANNISNFKVCGLHIDGNKANNTVGSDNIAITNGCYNFTVEKNTSYSAKYDPILGLGNGIFIDSNADATNKTASFVSSNTTYDNAVGIYVRKLFAITVNNNSGRDNTYGGIKFEDVTAPPLSGTTARIIVTGNNYTTSSVGIGFYGTKSGTTALGDIISQSTYTQHYSEISNNVLCGNSLYGLVVQALGVTCTGNIIQNNGNSTSNGGMLFNASNSVCANNIIRDNSYYGIDAGFAFYSQIIGNIVANNGSGYGQAIGINAGASKGLFISGNKIHDNGGALVGSYQILASGVDGAGGATNWAPFTGNDLHIYNNDIVIGTANSTGLRILNGFAGVEVIGNSFTNRANGSVIEIYTATNQTKIDKNYVINSSGNYAQSAASAATMVIPDYGDIITVTGTATVNYIKTNTQNTMSGKVFLVSMTNNGTGYTSAPTVTFTGGGGSGASGTAAVAADGKVYGVYIDNFGSGYTSAPTITFSGGGGSGATALAFINCDNSFDRVITLAFENAATINSGTGNIYLASTFVGSTIKTLVLRSSFGNWMEVARS